MLNSDWEPLYQQILSEFGYSRDDDEACVRVLKAVTVNSDLIDDDEALEFFSSTVTIVGNAPCLEGDVSGFTPQGKVIVSGSAVSRIRSLGIHIDVVVTDLDGDVESQIQASSDGALTFIHAHGDNVDLVRDHAWRFKGHVILTTQSHPENTVSNYGGFTDGDRAVCIARHFGARRLYLVGFDYDEPMVKEGSDASTKLRKLAWAKRIIGDSPDIIDMSHPLH